jgi:hypothetical protein
VICPYVKIDSVQKSISNALKVLISYRIFLVTFGFFMVNSQLWASEPSRDLLGAQYRWPDAKFTWYYSASNEPEWLSQESGLNLFKNAATAWAACGVEISYQGVRTNIVKPKDQINSLGWTSLAKSVRGITLRQYNKNTAFIKEADIVINVDNLDIQNNPSLLQKVITHEFGHALGLVHSEGCNDVMSSAAECGWRIANPPPTIPTSNDIAQCKARYHSHP